MNRHATTVGTLLEEKRSPRKRAYQELENEEAGFEEERVPVELSSKTREPVINEQDVYGHSEYMESDLPDEIECQLIQKTLIINGTVQTIDFIMCNQCPRLFRTENLLWNHIKGKHNRRGTVRKSIPPPPRKVTSPLKQRYESRLEPGEIQPHLSNLEYTGTISMEEEEEERDQRLGEELEVEGGEEKEEEEDEEDEEDEQQENQENLENNPPEQSFNQAPRGRPASQTTQCRPEAAGGWRPRQQEEGVYVVGVEKTRWAQQKQQQQQQTHRPEFGFDVGTGKFTCWKGQCNGEVFTNKKQIENHIKRFHETVVVECDICAKQVTNLQRHREVSHKQFRAFDCSHCGDKFCSNEDLDRHLRNVEARNRVSSQHQQNEHPKEATDDTLGEKEVDDEEDVEVARFVKELESQTFSCSDCGVKTPSRMTYIQHVLNGCIMDQLQNKVVRRERKSRPFRRETRGRMNMPLVTKHVIIQHEGRREHIIVEQDRDLGQAVREQLGHRAVPVYDLSEEKSILGRNKRMRTEAPPADPETTPAEQLEEQLEDDPGELGKEVEEPKGELEQSEDRSEELEAGQEEEEVEEGQEKGQEDEEGHRVIYVNAPEDDVPSAEDMQESEAGRVVHLQRSKDGQLLHIQQDGKIHVQGSVDGQVLSLEGQGASQVIHLQGTGDGQVLRLEGVEDGQVLHIVEAEQGEETHLLIQDSGESLQASVLQLVQEEEEAPVLEVVEDEAGDHVIHVTEEQLKQLRAQNKIVQQ